MIRLGRTRTAGLVYPIIDVRETHRAKKSENRDIVRRRERGWKVSLSRARSQSLNSTLI